jgi:adenine-specific DNA glycosylase
MIDEHSLQKLHIEPAAERLLECSREVGPFMPWHTSKDPYHWFVAEILLRCTTRSAARQAFEDLVTSYPTWEELASASRKEILDKIAWLGLGNQRSHHLTAMARLISHESQAIDLCRRDALLSLPGVGKYIAAVVQLHVCNGKTIPVDSSLQRVLRRVIELPIPTRTSHSEPYRDPWVEKAVGWIISGHSTLDSRIHIEEFSMLPGSFVDPATLGIPHVPLLRTAGTL